MIDLREVNRAQFRRAKRLWLSAMLTKFAAFIVGAWVVFRSGSASYAPQLALLLALSSELLQLWSDEIKSRAESLLRTLDVCKSFGRDISQADKRDIVASVSSALRRDLEGKAELAAYFASREAPGSRRAVENLLESAWYTRQQAGVMVGVYITLIVLLVGTSVAALIVAAREVVDLETRTRIVRIVTSWLLLLVSLSMAKSTWSYFKLYRRCIRTEATCGHLLHGEPAEADALRQWYEYQLVRASAPLLPDWLWRVMSARLETAWRSEGVR